MINQPGVSNRLESIHLSSMAKVPLSVGFEPEDRAALEAIGAELGISVASVVRALVVVQLRPTSGMEKAHVSEISSALQRIAR